jgi:hypothetical protein
MVVQTGAGVGIALFSVLYKEAVGWVQASAPRDGSALEYRLVRLGTVVH